MTREERLAGQEHGEWTEQYAGRFEVIDQGSDTSGLWDSSTKEYVSVWATPFQLIQGGLS